MLLVLTCLISLPYLIGVKDSLLLVIIDEVNVYLYVNNFIYVGMTLTV
jgi:hypothetical protein